MKKKNYISILIMLLGIFPDLALMAQSVDGSLIAKDNITWNSFSKDASASMPCGGGDIGLNVWVEKGAILFYIAKSDAFDENNALLKLGRIRIQMTPNPFTNGTFSQVLNLPDGSVRIRGVLKGQPILFHLWVDVHRPMIHGTITADDKQRSPISQPFNATVSYESWRTEDHIVKGKENNENSYKFGPQGVVKVKKDHIYLENDKALGGHVVFYHQNTEPTVFDATVHQQGLDSVKNQLYDPLKDRIFGGILHSLQLEPAGKTEGHYQKNNFIGFRLKTSRPVTSLNFTIGLHTSQSPNLSEWLSKTHEFNNRSAQQINKDRAATRSWWQDFWERSFIHIDPQKKQDSASTWKMGRNYQLFRYMLACNVYGQFPTRFNGGLFTYDPVLVDSSYPFTPDFRNWGGGTFTAQNQRLVYYPMLKSGDFDLMIPAFEFYKRLLKTAELRSAVYWHHKGASFTEQLENFGLPNPSEYGWKRPAGFDPGMQYNAWLEYEWDTVLEFCDMILQSRRFNGSMIKEYLPLIKSCLLFFDEHYQYLAKKRGARTLDAKGHLILYPGSAAETYKLTYNSTSTIAALSTVTRHLLQLPESLLDQKDREYFSGLASRIPPIALSEINHHPVIAPAVTWARINNTESPQLYPVFPWGIYGVGKPNLETARNTWKLDTNVIKFRSYIGWKQDNIFAARLGFAKEAFKLTKAKLKDGPRRFPAFWGPGYDWVPDHNWGGSAMIGLQEMLLQTNGDSILLFPAWPKKLDVHFKLHAPGKTTVEAQLVNGKIKTLKVLPKSRENEIINCLDDKSLNHPKNIEKKPEKDKAQI